MSKHTLHCIIVYLFFTAFLSSKPLIGQALKDTVLIDFGTELTALPWNNMPSATGGSITNMLNSEGYPSGIGISIAQAFNMTNTNGTQNPNPSLGFPSSATGDSFFGNTQEFGGTVVPVSSIEFSGLDPLREYQIVIFASRIATDNRETAYSVSGANTDTLYLNVSSNTSQTVQYTGFPATDSTIQVFCFPGPNNNNSYGFFYLGAIKLIYDHIPPGNASLSLSSPNGGEFWQSGKTPSIIWNSIFVPEIIIEFSDNAGISWSVIDTVPGYLHDYPWSVPFINSSNCLIRITFDSLSTVSNSVFEISGDSASCPLVILGSSTAFGAGAIPIDSSWVNRYSKALFQKNTSFSVINLAKGGYTTYHILPNGSTIPPGVNITVDIERNITKALTFNPAAIIINMPSNDAAYGFTASAQMNNYTTIVSTATNAGVPVWISTSQPRNFTDSVKIQIQFDIADSVMSVYGERAIDFWNGIADVNGFILSDYDSGDGIHLNNSGHYELFQKVFAKNIDTIQCNQIIVGISSTNPFVTVSSVFPNPCDQSVTLTMPYTLATVKIFAADGRLVFENQSFDTSMNIDMSTWHRGLYIIQIESTSTVERLKVIKQ